MEGRGRSEGDWGLEPARLIRKDVVGVLASVLHRPAPVELVPVTLADSRQPKCPTFKHFHIRPPARLPGGGGGGLGGGAC